MGNYSAEYENLQKATKYQKCNLGLPVSTMLWVYHDINKKT